MNQIKFSHKYKKLHGEEGIVPKLMLLDVWQVKLENLSKQFLDFDTDNGLFKLPEKGDYVALVFLKPKGKDLCITLRSLKADKLEYYRSKIGQVFEIVFVEPEK